MAQKIAAMREAASRNFQFILEIIEAQQLFENLDMVDTIPFVNFDRKNIIKWKTVK